MLAAIVNHLWQSTLFTLACASAALLLRNDAARARHWLWLAASFKYLIPFSVLEALGASLAGRAPAVQVLAEWSSTIATVAKPMGEAAASQALATAVLAVWVGGSSAVLYRWLSRSAELGRTLRGP